MSSVLIVLIVILYLIIAALAYKYAINKWDNKKWEKILFSLFWIGVIPLWAVYKLHMMW